MVNRVFFLLSVMLLAFFPVSSAENITLEGFEAVCADFKGDGVLFSEFASDFIRRVEKRDDEKAFILIYNLPDEGGSLDNAEITIGVIVDRFVKSTPPLYIRIFDRSSVKKETFEGNHTGFISFYRLLLEDLLRKDAVLTGIPVIIFDAERFIEKGVFCAEILIPVA